METKWLILIWSYWKFIHFFRYPLGDLPSCGDGERNLWGYFGVGSHILCWVGLWDIYISKLLLGEQQIGDKLREGGFRYWGWSDSPVWWIIAEHSGDGSLSLKVIIKIIILCRLIWRSIWVLEWARWVIFTQNWT